MKTTPTALTSEQLAARKAAQAFFGDLLTPQPRVRNASAAKKPKAAIDKLWGSQHSAKLVSNAKTFTPVLRIHRITTQICSTCGSVHTYTGTALYRFQSNGRKDGLAIELPTALPLPEALDVPTSVERVEESTEICATCIATCAAVDSILASAHQPHQRQLSLFL